MIDWEVAVLLLAQHAGSHGMAGRQGEGIEAGLERLPSLTVQCCHSTDATAAGKVVCDWALVTSLWLDVGYCVACSDLQLEQVS